MLKAPEIIAKIETLVHAVPAPGVTVAQLVEELTAMGQEILEVDEVNNRVLIAQKVEEV